MFILLFSHLLHSVALYYYHRHFIRILVHRSVFNTWPSDFNASFIHLHFLWANTTPRKVDRSLVKLRPCLVSDCANGLRWLALSSSLRLDSSGSGCLMAVSISSHKCFMVYHAMLITVSSTFRNHLRPSLIRNCFNLLLPYHSTVYYKYGNSSFR